MRTTAEVEGLYAAYGPSVFRRAKTLLSSTDAASDACQEVFMKVLNLDDRAALVENPLAWLYRTTTNLCLNRLRDEKRHHELLGTIQIKASVEYDLEARSTISHILSEVPQDLQEAAVYFYVDGMSHDEIADLIGASRRTVGNRLAAFRASVQLLVGGEQIS